MSTLGEALRKARKEHSCDFCCTAIQPGARYWRWGWAEEGTIVAVKAHQACRRVADKMVPYEYVEWHEHPVRELILDIEAAPFRDRPAHVRRLLSYVEPDLLSLARLEDDLRGELLQVIFQVCGVDWASIELKRQAP